MCPSVIICMLKLSEYRLRKFCTLAKISKRHFDRLQLSIYTCFYFMTDSSLTSIVIFLLYVAVSFVIFSEYKHPVEQQKVNSNDFYLFLETSLPKVIFAVSGLMFALKAGTVKPFSVYVM